MKSLSLLYLAQKGGRGEGGGWTPRQIAERVDAGGNGKKVRNN